MATSQKKYQSTTANVIHRGKVRRRMNITYLVTTSIAFTFLGSPSCLYAEEISVIEDKVIRGLSDELPHLPHSFAGITTNPHGPLSDPLFESDDELDDDVKEEESTAKGGSSYQYSLPSSKL